MANTPEKRTPGRISNLRAMFETGNSTSPLSSPTPDSRPKPLGRVKTSFVAIGGSQGVGLGLQKVETSDKDKSTDKLVDKDKNDSVEEFKTKSVKDDESSTKPEFVKVDVEVEKPTADSTVVKEGEKDHSGQAEKTVPLADETLQDKSVEEAAEAQEVSTDPILVQSDDDKAAETEKDTVFKVEQYTETKEDVSQKTSKDDIKSDTTTSREAHEESPAAPEKLVAVPSEEKSEDPLVVAEADIGKEALKTETETETEIETGTPVVPDPAVVSHAQSHNENTEVPSSESSIKQEVAGVPAEEELTRTLSEEAKTAEPSDIPSHIEVPKHEESQAVNNGSEENIREIEPSMQVTIEPEPAPEPEIAQEKETVPDVEGLVPDATLTQGSSLAEKIGVISEEKKPEVPVEPAVEMPMEKLPETKTEATSPAKAKKSKKNKKSKAAKDLSNAPQEPSGSTTQSQKEIEEDKPVQAEPEETVSTEPEVVNSKIEPEAPKHEEPVTASTIAVKDEPDSTSIITPLAVDQTDQKESEEKKEVQEPIVEPVPSDSTGEEKNVPLTDVIPDLVKDEILETKVETIKHEPQEESIGIEKATSAEIVEPEVSIPNNPVKQTHIQENTEDATPAPSEDAKAEVEDAAVDREVINGGTEATTEPVPEMSSQPDLDNQEIPTEDAPVEDKSTAPVAAKQQSPKAVKKPLTTSKVNDKKVLKPSTSSSSSQPPSSTKPSTTPAPVAKKAPVPKALLPSTRKPVETSNKPKAPEQPVKLTKAPVNASTASKKPEVKKPASPILPSQPVDENVTDPTSIVASDENVSEASDNKLKPLVDTTLMPPPVSPAAKIPPVAEKKPTKPKSSHSRTSSLVKNETMSVESPPKATVRQRPISAYAPTSSSASKTLTVKEPIKPIVKSSRSPSRLAALSSSTGRPSSRASNAHAPSPSRNDARAGERQFSSRQSMTSEMNIQSRTTKPIDSDFLTRLSRPTASSASKVVEKIPTTISHPAPHLPKKQSASQTRRKGDQDSHKDGEARHDSDEHDVEGQASLPVDEDDAQAQELVESDAIDQSTTQ